MGTSGVGTSGALGAWGHWGHGDIGLRGCGDVVAVGMLGTRGCGCGGYGATRPWGRGCGGRGGGTAPPPRCAAAGGDVPGELRAAELPHAALQGVPRHRVEPLRGGALPRLPALRRLRQRSDPTAAPRPTSAPLLPMPPRTPNLHPSSSISTPPRPQICTPSLHPGFLHGVPPPHVPHPTSCPHFPTPCPHPSPRGALLSPSRDPRVGLTFGGTRHASHTPIPKSPSLCRCPHPCPHPCPYPGCVVPIPRPCAHCG